MKTIISLLTFVAMLSMSYAQESDSTKQWKTGTSGNITFSQISLTNWAPGGEDSYSFNSIFDFFANYQKGKHSWENNLTMGYGFVKIIGDETQKATDQIDLESKYGKSISDHWSYSAMLNFKTQFAPGYQYPEEGDRVRISDFLAPGYIITALGMNYKTGDHFSLFLSPATGKTTLVMDDDLSDAGAFGVEPGDKMLSEYGGFVKMNYDTDILKNVNFKTKIDLFSAYNNNPENIDLDWEVMINMKINKFLSTNILTRMVYDHDTKIEKDDGTMAPMLQFKEVFGVGISYTFPEPEE